MPKAAKNRKRRSDELVDAAQDVENQPPPPQTESASAAALNPKALRALTLDIQATTLEGSAAVLHNTHGPATATDNTALLPHPTNPIATATATRLKRSVPSLMDQCDDCPHVCCVSPTLFLSISPYSLRVADQSGRVGCGNHQTGHGQTGK